MNADLIKTVLVCVLSAGFGVSLFSIFRGLDLWRGRTASTEARGIANLESMRIKAEQATAEAVHRLEYYRDELGPWYLARVGDCEYVIRTTPGLGPTAVPEAPPRPVMRPLPKMAPELEKKVKDNDDT